MDAKEIKIQKRNNFIFKSNLQDITDKVKLMKFNELHEQLKIYDYENEQLKEQVNQQKADNEKLNKKLQRFKDQLQEQQEKYKSEQNQIEGKISQSEDLKNQLEKFKIKINQLNKEKLNTLEVLEYNNSKSHANVKLIYQLYQNDKGIKDAIEKNVLKSLKKYEENENYLKRELLKNGLFLEQFAKLIVYLKNSFENKNQKIHELHHSMKLSQLFQGNNGSQKNIKQDLQSISEDNFGELNQQKIEDLKKKFDFMTDKIHATGKVENLVQLEELKDKLQLHIQKEESLIQKNDQQFEEIKQKTFQLQKNERNLQFVEKELDLILQKSNTKIEQSQQNQDSNPQNTNETEKKEQSSKNYKLILEQKIEQVKSIIDDQKIELEKVIKNLEEQQKLNQANGGSSDKIQRENIKKLNRQIEELMLEKEEVVIKFQKLEKMNKQIIRNNQKRQVFDFSREKMMAEYSDNQFNLLKSEIKLKDESIKEILSVNQSLIDRISDLEKNKMEVLREKQHCKNLFSYFNEKATEIHIMSENLSKVIRENKKLRRFIEELYLMLQMNVKVIEKDVKESLVNLDKVQIETLQAIIMASSKKEDFDATLLKTYLEKEGKNTDPRKKRKRANRSKMSAQQAGPTLKQIQEAEDREFQKVLKALNELDKDNLRQSDLVLSKKLNKTIVENIKLKQQIEQRADIIIELKTDLIQYKKKVKFIYNLEKKIEVIVQQNMKLKTLVHKLQKESIRRVDQNSVRVLDFGEKIIQQTNLVSKIQQKLLGMKNQINNLERRVQILKTQHQTIITNMTVMKEEHQQEIQLLTKKMVELNDEIIMYKEFKGKYELLKENFGQLQNELGKEQQENAKLGEINKMLEGHLFQIADRSKDNSQNLVNEIQSYKKKIDVKTDQQLNLIQEKINLTYEVEKLKEQVFDQQIHIKQKDNQLKEKNKKNSSLESEIQVLEEKLSNFRKNDEKFGIKIKNLTQENHRLKNENQDLQRNLEVQDTIINNNVTQERGLIYKKIKSQFEEENKKQELKINQLQNKYEELQQKMQKTNGDVDYLKRKLQMRNKQLIQFNAFMANMMEIPNPEIKENSKMMLQVKDQIKEIEKLKNKNKQLQMLYKNLQNNIDNYQISPPTQEQDLLNSQILEIKNNLKNTDEDDIKYKQKIEDLISYYEEKEIQAQNNLKIVQNKYILAKNKILSQQEELQDISHKLDEGKMQIVNLTEQNFQLMKEANASKKQLSEVQNQKLVSADQSQFIESLQKDNQNFKDQIQNLNETINQLKLNSEKIEEENQELKKQNEFLQFRMIKQSKEPQNQQQSEKVLEKQKEEILSDHHEDNEKHKEKVVSEEFDEDQKEIDQNFQNNEKSKELQNQQKSQDKDEEEDFILA